MNFRMQVIITLCGTCCHIRAIYNLIVIINVKVCVYFRVKSTLKRRITAFVSFLIDGN